MSQNAISSLGYCAVHNNVPIHEITKISDPTLKSDTPDTTSQDNPRGFKSVGKGWKTVSPVTITLNDVGSTDNANLWVLADAQTSELWYVLDPMAKGGGIVFTGFISSIKRIHDDTGKPVAIEIIVTSQGPIDNVVNVAAGLTTPWLSITDQTTNALTVTPTPAANLWAFQATAYTDTTGVKIMATAAVGTITVAGAAATTGTPTSAIPINQGQGAITTIGIVVGEYNKAPRVYTLTITVGSNHS
jgi:hypothetical protein